MSRLEKIVRQVQCDRCEKTWDAPDVEDPGSKKGQKQQAKPPDVDATILGVAVKFEDLCDGCKQRIKNLVHQMNNEYDKAEATRTRRRKTSEAAGEAQTTLPMAPAVPLQPTVEDKHLQEEQAASASAAT